METPESVEGINRRLGEIQDQLLDLEQNDFAARYELQLERDQLRDMVRSNFDRDAERSTDDLLGELEARRNALKRIQRSMVNSAGMSGGGGDGVGSFEGPGDGLKLNSALIEGTGAKELSQRIARLETILTERRAL
jgi:hypothetical protein